MKYIGSRLLPSAKEITKNNIETSIIDAYEINALEYQIYCVVVNDIDFDYVASIINHKVFIGNKFQQAIPGKFEFPLYYSYVDNRMIEITCNQIMTYYENIQPSIISVFEPLSIETKFKNTGYCFENVRILALNSPCIPIWSLFYRNIADFRDTLAMIPKDNKIWYCRGKNINDSITDRFLNSISRLNNNFLCLIDLNDKPNNRNETTRTTITTASRIIDAIDILENILPKQDSD